MLPVGIDLAPVCPGVGEEGGEADSDAAGIGVDGAAGALFEGSTETTRRAHRAPTA